jgi:hypothetical protein
MLMINILINSIIIILIINMIHINVIFIKNIVIPLVPWNHISCLHTLSRGDRPRSFPGAKSWRNFIYCCNQHTLHVGYNCTVPRANVVVEGLCHTKHISHIRHICHDVLGQISILFFLKNHNFILATFQDPISWLRQINLSNL